MQDGARVVAFGPGGEGYLRLCFAHAPARIEGAMQRLRTGLQAARLDLA